MTGVSSSAAGFALLVLASWLGWRWPTLLLLSALSSLAVRPEGAFDYDVEMGCEWGLQQSLIAFALVVTAGRYGVRRRVNWPILALTLACAVSLLFGKLHPGLTPRLMLMSLALLALPWSFTQVVMPPGSRGACTLMIALLPLLSVAAGWLLNQDNPWGPYFFRLKGATGNAAIFAALAFAGLTVALHEATRSGRPYVAYLAVLNLALVILSGSRTAMFTSLVFIMGYLAVSSDLRKIFREHVHHLWIWGSMLAAAIVWYFPLLQARLWRDGAISLSGRPHLWSFYFDEFLVSPIFGRGFGAGFVAAADWLEFYPAPHNEYLHLLVVGGIVGFSLCMTGIAIWFYQLFSTAEPQDRQFLIPAVLSLAVYAMTDNVLTYPASLASFACFGVLLTPSAAAKGQDAAGQGTGNGEVDRSLTRSGA
jgi:O-antigen ligase